MGERYDIGVDIGEGRDWWYVHGRTTHDKVYELNKQMCDIESGLSNDLLGVQMLIADKLAKDVVEGARTFDWAKNMLAGIPEQLSRAKYEILDEILKEKNRFMEEKKTKKMTKAEAFEYLKGKKVYANGKGKEVQMKLFECGVSWATNHFVYYDFGDYLLIETNGYLYHCGHEGDSYWRLHHFKEISVDDILSIEIVDEKKKSENVSIELEKWIGVIRDKFCCNHWSIVISASNFALFSGDLIEEKRIKE